MDLGLAGKVAVVTGAGAGLGRAYALGLAREQVAVVVADVDTASAAGVADQITAAGGKAVAAVADVSDEASVATMVNEAIRAFGGIDILVNNAGWRPMPTGALYSEIPNDTQTADQWRRIFDVNVIGALICARACRESMRERGGGVVINQTSMAAYEKPAGPYGVSKVALSGLTIALAAELAPDNIRVNGLAPGIMTQRATNSDRIQAIVDRQLIARKGTPEDLVGPLLFLASDMSGFVTGVNLIVDGGIVRRV